LANHKSAIKRTRQSEQRRLRNRSVRTRVKSATKTVQALSGGNESAETTLSVLSNAQSVIDRAANKGVIHKRAAARRKSRLARLVNKMSAAA